MGSPVPPGTGPLSPDFSGLDPEQMERFIAELDRGRGVIGENLEAIRRELAAVGIFPPELNRIAELARWIDEQLPDLRRRARLARETAKWPGWAPVLTGLVAYDEKRILPAAEAQRLGRALAERYNRIDPDPPLGFAPGLDEELRRIVAELREHALDPDFAAAFFGALGPRRTVELPRRLRLGLPSGDEAKAIETVSIAFGSAVAGAATSPGFRAVDEAVRRRRDDHEERQAIGDLLSAGRFPTEWLAKVAFTQVLAYGSRDPAATLTPYLNALAKDPAAARLALALSTREIARFPALPLTPFGTSRSDSRPDLATYLRWLTTRVGRDAEAADAFGRVLAAASGAYDEADGRHSEPAARFAFTVITRADEWKVPPAMRVHLAEIAGAYASEIAEGADLGDDNQLQPSAFGPVASRIPGLSPAFRLSPADTYRFLTTFAATDTDLAPFEAGLGNLARRLIDHNVPLLRRTGDPTQLSAVFAVLGNVRGFELAAAEAVRGPLDERRAAGADAVSVGGGALFGIVGLAIPGGLTGQALWTALSTGWSAYDTYKPDPPKGTDHLMAADRLETLGRRHAVATALLQAGFRPQVSPGAYQAACPPGVAIADDRGNLRPFADIAKSGEPGLQALDRWFIANGLGKDDKLALGELAGDLADRFDGRKQQAAQRAAKFGTGSGRP